MAFNRELSQFANYLVLDAGGNYIGISTAETDANVGIGSATPESKLTVDGDAKVSGMLTATGGFSGDLFGTADFAKQAHSLTTARNISLAGDINGTVSFDGTQDVTIQTVIQNNSIVLGDDTEGNYVQDISAGSANIEVTGSGTETASVTIDLSDTTVTAGTYGAVDAVPVLEIDAKGRVTNASTVTVATDLNIAGDTGSDAVDLLSGTFSVTGGTYVDTDAANDGVNITVRGTSQSTPDYLVARDASGNFSANMITSDITGDLTGTAQFATDAHGLTNMRTFQVSGDGTAPAVSFDGTQNVDLNLTLANTGVTAGEYGSGSYVPVINVDSKGRITSATTTEIGTNLSVAADTGSEDVDLLTDTLRVTGGANITTGLLNDEVTVDLDADIALTSISLSGTLGVTGTSTLGVLNAGASTLASADVTGAATVGTTLDVTGTSTLGVLDAGASTLASLGVTGAAAVGTTLDVTGDTTLAGLTAGASTLNSAAITNNTTIGGTLGVTGTSTLTALNATATSVTTLTTSGAAAIGTDLTVAGNSVVDGTSQVKSAAQFDSTVDITGATTLSSTLDVSGATSLTSSLDVTGTTTVDVFNAGASTLASATVTGAATVGTTLDVTGAATVGGTLGVSGATTLAGLTAGASTLESAAITNDAVIGGDATATSFKTGALGQAIIVNNDSITGPSSITIDPGADQTGDGTLYVLGNLQVKGTQTVIDSTVVSVEDLNIVVAKNAANDAAADGGGFTVESGDGNKTFQYEGDALEQNFGSSENLNLALGKVYKINNVEILSATTLGGSVVNSSLTSVGTLVDLDVAGATTLGSTLDVTGATTLAGLTADASTLASLGVTGAATVGTTLGVTGATTVGGTLGVSGATTLAGLTAGASTLASADVTGDATVGGNTALGGNIVVDGTSRVKSGAQFDSTVNVAGASTLASADVTGAATVGTTLDVTGATTLAGLTAGASTLASASVTNNATVGGTLGVTGATTLNDALNVSGSTTLAGLTAGATTLASSSVTGNSNVGGNFGVVGHTTLDTVIAGISTVSTLDVTGAAAVGANLTVAGTSTVDGVFTANAAAQFNTTASVTDTLTVGGATVLANTLDVTGVTTLDVVNAGDTTVTTFTAGASTLASATVTGAATVGTTLGVTGATTLSDTLDVTGDTTLSTLTVSGLATLQSSLDLTGDLTINGTKFSIAAATGNANVGGSLDAEDTITAPEFSGELSGAAVSTSADGLVNTGITTVTNTIEVKSDDGSVAGIDLFDDVNNTYYSRLQSATNAQLTGNVEVTMPTVSGNMLVGDANISNSVNTSGIITATSFVGPLTGNADTATTLETAREFSIIGDVDAPVVSFDGSGNVVLDTTLDSTGVTAGDYGSSTQIPTFTVDEKGRLTAAGGVDISTDLNIAADAGTVDVNLLTETLSITGSTYVNTSVDVNEIIVNVEAGAANVASTLVARDASGNFAAGEITASRFIGLADRATQLETTRTFAASGDATAPAVDFNGTQSPVLNLTLNTVNSNVGTFGSSNQIPQFTVNAKGLVTGVTNVAISTALSLDDGSGNGSVNLLNDGLSVLGSDYIETQVVGSNLTVSLKGDSANIPDKAVVRDANGDFAAGMITADLTGRALIATTADELETTRNISIAGPVVGNVDFNGGSDVTINVTQQPDSVELRTHTTGDYVESVADSGLSDITIAGNGEGGAVEVGLTTTGVNAGTYGATGSLPIFTVDSRGRITSATTTSVSTELSITGDSGSDAVDLLNDTLDFEGDSNLTTEVTDNKVSVSLNQNVAVSGNMDAASFRTGTEGDSIIVTGTSITGPSSITIDPAGIGDNTGELYVMGDLIVKGTTTTVNSVELAVADKNITLADGATSNAVANGGGLTIEAGADGAKTFQFEEIGLNFGSSENMNLAVSKVYKIDNTSVLSATTLGAAVVNSSLEVVGTINTGVWQGTAINDDYIDFIDNANKVKISALDIDAVAEIGTPIADGDLMIIDDGADGTNRSMTVDRMPVYTFSKVSGDILIDSTGVATIQPNSVNLATDTTGNYVATITATNIDVTNSGTEDAAVTLDLSDTTVTAGSYGSTTAIPTFTVDEKGRLTAAGTVQVDTTLDVSSDVGAIDIDQQTETLAIEGVDGEISGTATGTKVELGLVDTGVAAGSYGSATAIPTFTVDAKGRLSESSTVAIGTAMTLAGDTGSEVIEFLNDTMTISGDTHVSTDASNDTLTISVDATSADVASTIVARDADGSFSAGIVSADLSGDVYSVGISTFNEFRVNTKIYDSVGSSGAEKQTIGIDATTGNLIWQDLTEILPQTRTTQSQVATEGDTQFFFNYNASFLDVFVNGVKLNLNEYIATDETSITLIEPLFDGDVVEFHSYAVAGGGLGVVEYLGDLRDVTLGALAQNDILVYNGSGFVNQQSMNLSGGITAATIDVNAITATGAITADSAAIAGNVSVGSLTLNGDASVSGSIIPSADNTYDLGSPDRTWRDLYLADASLYIDGQKVLHSDNDTIVVSADPNQNLSVQTTGTGDIELSPASDVGGTGSVQMKGNLVINTGFEITSTAGAVKFNSNLAADVIESKTDDTNLTLRGNGAGAVAVNDDLTVIGDITAQNLTADIDASNIKSGTVATARLGAGTADGTTFLSGDGTWKEVDSTALKDDNGQIKAQASAAGLTVSGTLAADTLVGDLDVANLSGIVDPANLGTGTADATTFLRGDGSYAVVDSTSLKASAGGAVVAQASSSGILVTGVATADSFVTAGGLEMTGAKLSGPAEIVLDPAGDDDVAGTLRIKGDLVVDGTTTTINTATLDVTDANITVAKGATLASAVDGAGLTIDGANATFVYDFANSALKSSENINIAAGKVYQVNGNEVLTATTVLGKSMPTGEVVGSSDSQTLTGKSIDGAANTLTNIANASLVNSTVSFGGVQLALGGSNATPAFDLADATNLPTTSLTGTITNAQLAGAIANDKLVNQSVSFGGISLNLGETDATPAFNLIDATGYKTESLVGTIANAQLAGSIPNDKLANSTISGHALGTTLSTLSMSTDTHLSGSATYNGSGAATFEVSIDATATNTASTVVARDVNGNFAAGTITANLAGNALTADHAVTTTDSTNSQNVRIDGAADADAAHYLVMSSTASGQSRAKSDGNLVYNPASNTLTTGTFVGALTGNVTGNADTATLAADSSLLGGESKAYFATAADLSALETTVGVVTFSGAYGDLTGVPTNVSQFANDANYLVAGDNISSATEAATLDVQSDNVTDTERFLTFVQNGTGYQNVATDSDLKYNPALNRLTADLFRGAVEGDVTGDLTGNADTATTATNLANAANINAGLINQDRIPATLNKDISGTAADATRFGGQLPSYYAVDADLNTEVAARISAVSAEETARISADNVLDGKIDDEIANRTTAISAEVTARNNAITNAIDAATALYEAADTTLQTNINNEASTRASADTALSGRLDTLEADPTTGAALTAETNARVAADALKYDKAGGNISGDVTIATDKIVLGSTGDASFAGNVSVGTTATADVHLANKKYVDERIASVIDNAPAALDTLSELAAAMSGGAGITTSLVNQISDETTARVNADDAEETARIAADDALSGRLDTLEADPTTGAALTAEATARANADSAEATARANADTALSGRLDTLESDPTTATALTNAISAEVIARDAAIATASAALSAEIDADIAAIPAFDDSHLMPKSGNTTVTGELTANKFIGPVDGEVGGAGSTPAPVTGTTITANTKFVGALEGNADTATLAATATYAINAGIATTADRLTTAVNVGGVLFDGSASINLPGVNVAGNQDTSGNAATASALASVINVGGIAFDGGSSIDLPGVNLPGTQDTSGNAATATFATSASASTTATKLAASVDIGGVSFDGSANIDLPGVNVAGNQNTSGNAGSATVLATARTIGGVSFDGSANIDLPGVNATGNQNTTGNAATASALASAVTIGGVSFNGSANIDLPGVNVAGNQNTSGNAATATDASQLGGLTGAYYLNYANFTNVPALVDSLGQGTLVVSDLANDAGYATTSFVTTQIANIDNLETAGGAMTGYLSLHADPVLDLQAATKRYVDNQDDLKVSKSGSTMTGDLVLNGAPSIDNHASTKKYVDDNVATRLPLTGGTLTGSLVLAGPPNANFHAANKGYVDSAIASASSSGSSSTFTGIVTATSFSTGELGQSIIVSGTSITGPSSITIDPSGIGDNTGDVFILGNLEVKGTTTTINSTSVEIDDVNLTLAGNAANASQADGAGLTVAGANATFTYDSSEDRWVANKAMQASEFVGNVTGNVTGDVTGDVIASSVVSTTAQVGALKVGAGTTYTSDVVVEGTMRVTGQLDIGTGTITINPDTDEIDLNGTVMTKAGDGEIEFKDRLGNRKKVKTIAADTLTSDDDVTSKRFVDNRIAEVNNAKLGKSGGTLTGDLILRGAPTQDNEASTKKYVDDVAQNKADVTFVNAQLADKADTTYVNAQIANKVDADYVAAQIATIDNSNLLAKTGGTMTGDLDMGSNKITYSNVYMTEADLPNASTYHGMFAHVHTTGAGYFAHAGQWVKLQNEGARVVLPSGSNATPELTFAADSDTGIRCPAPGEVSVVCNGGQAAKFSSNGVESQNFNATSDITLKQDISIIDNAMEMIQNLEGINWSWKNNGKAAMGVSAQNVEQVAPQLVGQGEYKSVNYNGLVGILIEAVKSLKKEIDELKK